jgi:hypothetical protein
MIHLVRFYGQHLRGADDSEGGEISIDPLGNMYLVGSFTSSPLTFGKHSLICEGRTDIFIVKYDSKGSVIWAKSIGGLDKENCSGFSMDEKANIFNNSRFKKCGIFRLESISSHPTFV